MSVIIFLIILSVLVVVHELGHFLIAKKFGIRVDEFGLGFPPRAFGRKIGKTIYSLNWIPFGGFVKIFGENGEEKDAGKPTPAATAGVGSSDSNLDQSFQKKNRAIQTLVLSGGVLFNLIFAWLLVSFGFMAGFPAPISEYAGRGTVSEIKLVVTDIIKDSPVARAGLKIGDTITALKANGRSLDGRISPEELRSFVQENRNTAIEISIKRGDEESKISAKSEIVEGNQNPIIGVATDEIGLVRLSPISAVIEGAETTYNVTVAVAEGLYYFVVGLVTGQSSVKDLTGPVGIASLVGEAGRLGFIYLLSFTAFISINLAVLNFAPFPALDGGRIVIVVIEAVIRRPLPAKWTGTINTLGFIFLLALMLLVTYRDIAAIFN